MQRTVAAVLVTLFVVATAVLVYLGRDEPSAAAGADPGAGAGAPAETSSMVPATPAAPPARPATNVPDDVLAPGETPPQFVLVSFDGAGSHDAWGRLLDVAADTNARFTAFLSGVYLLGDAAADRYTPPGRAPGRSAIGFGGDRADITVEIEDLNAAYAAGHEIGTHYMGHFCAGDPPSGDDFTRADWKAELDAFFHVLGDWDVLNGYTGADLPRLAVTADDIRGGRTPCLEGDMELLAPELRARGFTYDTSKNLYTGIGWPTKDDGLWHFQVPYVYSPGFDGKIVPVDHIMWAKFNGAKDDPADAAGLKQAVRATVDYMFESAYEGNRAPVVVSSHFSARIGGAAGEAVLEFMAEVCGEEDVVCATYSDVVAWLERQDSEVLDALARQPVVATGAEFE